TLGSDGTFYGTTASGGLTCPNQNGCGTVFRFKPNPDGTWTKGLLHRFNGTDGANPFNLAIDPEGNLFGENGGGGSLGFGNVFELKRGATGWTYEVVYSFSNGLDGEWPEGSITTDNSGNLYGTTGQGGENHSSCGGIGCGTVFKLSPSGQSWSFELLNSFNEA